MQRWEPCEFLQLNLKHIHNYVKMFGKSRDIVHDDESQAHNALLGNAYQKEESEELYVDAVDTEIDEAVRSERLSRLSYGSSFSALHPSNSAYLTTFLLLNTMIGSGILNQPYVFAESGILGGLLGFFITTIATWTGLLCLTEAGVHENILEYSGLAKKAFPAFGELMVDIAIIVLTFGSQLGYILVVGTLSSDLLRSWGCSSVACGDMFTTIISVAVFVTPVCMYRHFGHLAILSLFSIAAIVAVLLLVFIAGPIKHSIDHKSSNYKLFDLNGMLTSVGSIVFSMECCSANFQAFVSTERKSRNMNTWRSVTGVAVFAGAIMCASMGLVGYLSFGSDTEGEILDNFTQHGYDVFKLMVVIHLILYIPVNFVIMRYSIVKVFFQTRSELLPSATHSIITIGLLAATVGIVLLLLGLGLESGAAFSLLLNITGGIGGTHSLFVYFSTHSIVSNSLRH